MKKILGAVVLLAVAAVGIVYFQLGTIIKTGTEEYGPQILHVDVGLDGASVSPLDGSASLKGLRVGQPQGFGEGNIFTLDGFDLMLEPRTLFTDHIIIDSVTVEAPFIDIRMQGKKSNFEALTAGIASQEAPAEESPITLTIRSLRVLAPTASLTTEGLLKVDEDIKLADFTLTDLGTDEEGLAPKEIARHIMDALEPQIRKAVLKAQTSGRLEDLTKGTVKTLEKGITGLLSKKKKKEKE